MDKDNKSDTNQNYIGAVIDVRESPTVVIYNPHEPGRIFEIKTAKGLKKYEVQADGSRRRI